MVFIEYEMAKMPNDARILEIQHITPEFSYDEISLEQKMAAGARDTNYLR